MEGEHSIRRRREQNREAQRRFRAKRRSAKTARNHKSIIDDEAIEEPKSSSYLSEIISPDVNSSIPEGGSVPGSVWDSIFDDFGFPFDGDDVNGFLNHNTVDGDLHAITPPNAAQVSVGSNSSVMQGRPSECQRLPQLHGDTHRRGSEQRIILSDRATQSLNEVLNLYRTGTLLGILSRNDEIDYSICRLLRAFQDLPRDNDSESAKKLSWLAGSISRESTRPFVFREARRLHSVDDVSSSSTDYLLNN